MEDLIVRVTVLRAGTAQPIRIDEMLVRPGPTMQMTLPPELHIVSGDGRIFLKGFKLTLDAGSTKENP